MKGGTISAVPAIVKTPEVPSEKLKKAEPEQSITKPLDDMTVIGIVTHNGRIKCLLESIGVKIMRQNAKNKKEEMRFKNCAIISLTIKNNNLTVKLEYDGEIGENAKNSEYYYFTTSETNSKNIHFDDVSYNKLYNDDVLKKLQLPLDTNNKVIYIIRHGDGVHNKMNFSQKFGTKLSPSQSLVDASLTDLGKTQAENAGLALKNVVFNYLFVSDLKRTRETLSTILINIKKANITQKKIAAYARNDVYVLPCSHELKYNKSGDCDGSQKLFNIKIADENKTSCKINTLDTNNCNNIYRFTEKSLSINWKYYKEFYNEQMRNDDLSAHNNNCANINMISMIFYIIQASESVPSPVILSQWMELYKPPQKQIEPLSVVP
jgi:broad specificity phosphatase PhoE